MVMLQHRRTQRDAHKVDDIVVTKQQSWLRQIADNHIQCGPRKEHRVLPRGLERKPNWAHRLGARKTFSGTLPKAEAGLPRVRLQMPSTAEQMH